MQCARERKNAATDSNSMIHSLPTESGHALDGCYGLQNSQNDCMSLHRSILSAVNPTVSYLVNEGW